MSAKIQKGFSLLVIAFVFLFPHYSYLPLFLYVPIVLLVVWLFLKYVSKESFKNIFFSFKNFETKSIWVGALSAVILFGALDLLFLPLLKMVFPREIIDVKDFDFIKHNPINFIFVLLMALVVGGFYEELVFHGFIFTRFEKLFSSTHYLTLSFILTNILFGAYHYQQGILGVITALIAGCAYHGLMLKYDRNLWYGLFFHAFFDFLGLTFIFLGHR
ncbi:MAG TPA: CPBP family intramembrane glutamic endopeptidase [Puia sp.]|nr:CPBP family intramembrane glutamic endopeptidase [Puia sp.]